MRELREVFEPCCPDLAVIEQFSLLILEFLNRHFVLGDEFGMLHKELFGVRLDDFPGRVGDNRVETSAPMQHLIELIAPVKRSQRPDIRNRQRALCRLAACSLRRVPGRLLEAYAQTQELFQQQRVQRLFRLSLQSGDRVAHPVQIPVIRRRIAVRLDQPVLFVEHFPVRLCKRQYAL